MKFFHADCRTDKHSVPCAAHSEVYVLVEVRAASPESGDGNRTPLDIALVLDKSESMAGQKLHFAKEAAKCLVNNLSLHDRLGIVTYGDGASTLIRAKLVREKGHLGERIDSLRASGQTNLGAGWLKANRMLGGLKGSDSIKRIFVLTDGKLNAGKLNGDKLLTEIRKARDNGIITTAFGFGRNFDEAFLIDLAAAGGGNFYFVDSPSAAPKMFAQELTGLVSLLTDDLSVVATLDPQVRYLCQETAYPVAIHGSEVHFRIGDIYTNELAKILMRIQVPPRFAAGEYRVMQVGTACNRIMGQPSSSWGDSAEVVPVSVSLNFAELEDGEGYADDVTVQKEITVMRLASAIDEAKRETNMGHIDSAAMVIDEAREHLAMVGLDRRSKKQMDNLLRDFSQELHRGSNSEFLQKSMASTVFNLRRKRNFGSQE